MVRSLSADMPTGIDLSKAKAWGTFDGNAVSIYSSFNIESFARTTNPGVFKMTFATPFKENLSGNQLPFVVVGTSMVQSAYDENVFSLNAGTTNSTSAIEVRNDGGTGINAQFFSVVWFGELENE